MRCRSDKLEKCTSTEKLSTTNPTTAIAPQPQECKKAINLTKAWRLDYSGSGIMPVNNDLNQDTLRMIDQGRPWFRFRGQAGVQLLNRCVLWKSCGTAVNLFSNSTMPAQVGVVTHMNLYGASQTGNCQHAVDRGSVMRCSDKPHDYVYRYDGNNRGYATGFCGMTA